MGSACGADDLAVGDEEALRRCGGLVELLGHVAAEEDEEAQGEL